MTGEHPKREPFACPDPQIQERFAEVEKLAAVSWTAVTGFQGEVRGLIAALEKKVEDGFTETHLKQDTTNGRLRWLERFSWTAAGGLAVLTFLVATFGVAALVMMR